MTHDDQQDILGFVPIPIPRHSVYNMNSKKLLYKRQCQQYSRNTCMSHVKKGKAIKITKI